MALRQQCSGPVVDPEMIPALPRPAFTTLAPNVVAAAAAVAPAPITPPQEQTLDLGGGVMLKLVRVAAEKPFWIGVCEVSNGQFRKFNPQHNSRYYQKRYPPLSSNAAKHIGPDALPLTLNDDRQPAVRVSWEQAQAFCRWLGEKTGRKISLPSEAQWLCCAGKLDADFSRDANLADATFGKGLGPDGKQMTGGLEHLVLEGAALADAAHNDGHIVTAPIGSFRPNAWGLCDMFGNAAEWTRTPAGSGRYVVRGGSFFDAPRFATARTDYPAWQRVFNIGFRIVLEDAAAPPP